MRRPALDRALDEMRDAAADGLRQAASDMVAAFEWSLIAAALLLSLLGVLS